MTEPRHTNKMASLFRFATLLSSINHNLFICILISLSLMSNSHSRGSADAKNDDGGRRLTKVYSLKQGDLRGFIVQPSRLYSQLQSVEIFLGVPYAAPPIGNLRFMPPGSPIPWTPQVRMATRFQPVCPQMLPKVKKENPSSLGRQQYMSRIIPYLKEESEDCLYLNIYAPFKEQKTKRYPVLVFIHGDSFEWSSGNPYDGRTLASYGNVMVVTINFRLGILGFMKPSLTEHVYGNNGLLDQLAALQWIKENIEVLNGDPNSVTVMGHGTGAASVNFLMMSPISNGLFHRAILMSGSALSDWALTKDPAQYTLQVAQSLNCSVYSKRLMDCLQNKPLAEIKKVQVLARKYETPLGPTVAGSFVPNEPAKTMESFPNLFSKYELLSGVTEVESYHDFGVIELAHGVLETERDEVVTQYAKVVYENAPDVALREIIKEYSPQKSDPQRWTVERNREFVLDVLSDARTVAPLVKIVNYHARSSRRSYFYVFAHNSESTEYAPLLKSVNGEELPYVFGVPLGGTNTHFPKDYTPKEKLLSEVVMTFWSNFIKSGTPNTQRMERYLTLGKDDWGRYSVDWPEYNLEHQSYVRFDTPPSVSSFYRSNYTTFWNDHIEEKMNSYSLGPVFQFTPVREFVHPKKSQRNPGGNGEKSIRVTPKKEPPIILQSSFPAHYGKVNTYIPAQPPLKPKEDDVYRQIQSIKKPSKPLPSILEKFFNENQVTASPKRVDEQPRESSVKASGVTVNVIIIVGCLFLVVNIVVCGTLYFKKKRLKRREREIEAGNPSSAVFEHPERPLSKNTEKSTYDKLKSSCNVFNFMGWNRVQNEPIKKNKKKSQFKANKSDGSGGFEERFKLRRHLSTSTIDAHTKVRDWIANEIIHRCSPPIIRQSNLDVTICEGNLSPNKPFTRSDELITRQSTNNKQFTSQADHAEKNSTLSTIKSSKKSKVSQTTVSTSTHGSQSSIQTHKELSLKKKNLVDKSTDSLKSKESTKSKKVSVAVDATPAAMTSDVLKQKPINLSKSLDDVDSPIGREKSSTLRRSKTDDKCSKIVNQTQSLKDDIDPQSNLSFKSEVNIALKDGPNKVKEVLRVSHKHSSSDPVQHDNTSAQSLTGASGSKTNIPQYSTFKGDVNVTSRDERLPVTPLSAAETLLHIQRRNYPRVLPEYPKNQSLNKQKRLSLQPTTLQSFKGYQNESDITVARIPPLPPPRLSSTIDRKNCFKNPVKSNNSSFDSIETNKINTNSLFQNYANIEASEIKGINYNKTLQNEKHIYQKDIDKIGRDQPKIIIASSDIPGSEESTIIIKPIVNKTVKIPENIPKVRLPEDFHANSVAESETSDCSLSGLSYSDIDEFIDDDLGDDEADDSLIRELVGDCEGISNITEPIDKKLEIVPVKVNLNKSTHKNYESIIYAVNDASPEIQQFVDTLNKTAKIKPQHSLHKLQNKTEAILMPPEKTHKLPEKKTAASVILRKSYKSKKNHEKTKLKVDKEVTKDLNNETKLEHSTSGSSNDTETSTGTVKKLEIKK